MYNMQCVAFILSYKCVMYFLYIFRIFWRILVEPFLVSRILKNKCGIHKDIFLAKVITLYTLVLVYPIDYHDALLL